uniref:Ubiquitin-like protease family profile domain-containing protein n=1 Tax=Cucumis melo TaxID=3656 RepID=A0A9I9EBN2_CUCME
MWNTIKLELSAPKQSQGLDMPISKLNSNGQFDIASIKECPLQVGVVECGYYVIRYMRDIITNGSIVVTDSVC